MTTGKTIALTRWTFVDKVTSLLFNMLSRLVITFIPRSKRLLISWLQSPSARILEPKKIMSVTVSIVSLSIFHEVMGPDAVILVFWMLSFQSVQFSLVAQSCPTFATLWIAERLSFKLTFSLSSFTFIKRLFSSSSLLPWGWYHLHIWDYWYFSWQSWFQLVLPPAQCFSWCTLHVS